MFDNTIRDQLGRIVGFQCSVCGAVKNKMWGTICNECRERRKLIKLLQKEGKKDV